jgi:hypothetical protein
LLLAGLNFAVAFKLNVYRYTQGYRPAELFQAATATQCFRFVDSQVDFEDHEVSLLLRALQSSSCERRADFFERVRAVRRGAVHSSTVYASRQLFHLLLPLKQPRYEPLHVRSFP